MKDKKHKIYLTTNLINGKIYIGRSCGKLKCEGGTYLGSGTNISDAIKEFGNDNFSQIILEIVDYKDMSTTEQKWINYYKSYDESIGYNNKFGGKTSKSPEQKALGKKYLNC